MLVITTDSDIAPELRDQVDASFTDKLGEPCKVIPLVNGVYRITPRDSGCCAFQKTFEKLKDIPNMCSQNAKEKSQDRNKNGEFILKYLLPFGLGFFAARFLKR